MGRYAVEIPVANGEKVFGLISTSPFNINKRLFVVNYKFTNFHRILW